MAYGYCPSDTKRKCPGSNPKKSREHVPLILRGEVEELIGRLDMEPESSGPYHRFLEKLTLPQINAAMGTLYAVSIGNSGNAEDQIDELITKNLEMLDIADSERLKDNTAGMYLLFPGTSCYRFI